MWAGQPSPDVKQHSSGDFVAASHFEFEKSAWKMKHLLQSSELLNLSVHFFDTFSFKNNALST